MTVKYQGTSGKIATEDVLRKVYEEKHPDSSDTAFDIWLYLGIECGAIKVITN